MKEFPYTITDPIGIHARPAGLLVKQLVTQGLLSADEEARARQELERKLRPTIFLA